MALFDLTNKMKKDSALDTAAKEEFGKLADFIKINTIGKLAEPILGLVGVVKSIPFLGTLLEETFDAATDDSNIPDTFTNTEENTEDIADNTEAIDLELEDTNGILSGIDTTMEALLDSFLDTQIILADLRDIWDGTSASATRDSVAAKRNELAETARSREEQFEAAIAPDIDESPDSDEGNKLNMALFGALGRKLLTFIAVIEVITTGMVAILGAISGAVGLSQAISNIDFSKSLAEILMTFISDFVAGIGRSLLDVALGAAKMLFGMSEETANNIRGFLGEVFDFKTNLGEDVARWVEPIQSFFEEIAEIFNDLKVMFVRAIIPFSEDHGELRSERKERERRETGEIESLELEEKLDFIRTADPEWMRENAKIIAPLMEEINDGNTVSAKKLDTILQEKTEALHSEKSERVTSVLLPGNDSSSLETLQTAIIEHAARSFTTNNEVFGSSSTVDNQVLKTGTIEREKLREVAAASQGTSNVNAPTIINAPVTHIGGDTTITSIGTRVRDSAGFLPALA